jgi:hypothetical protein
MGTLLIGSEDAGRLLRLCQWWAYGKASCRNIRTQAGPRFIATMRNVLEPLATATLKTDGCKPTRGGQ